MTSIFDKFNLRPQERRLVVVVFIVVFIVLNLLFVWPLFDDWKLHRSAIDERRTTLKRYRDEVGKIESHQRKLESLQNVGGDVPSQEQALQLQVLVNRQAIASGVLPTQYTPGASTRNISTNQFFDEQVLAVRVSTGTKELVDFLVNIAANTAMIRVRDLDLRPDPSQTKLSGTMTLVASYQRKPGSARPAPANARRR